MSANHSIPQHSKAKLSKLFSVVSAAVLGVVFLACPAAGAQHASGDNAPPPVDGYPILAVGSHAPDFSLPGIDGKTHSLKDYNSSKLLAVIFTCNHCPVAQMYEKRIKQLVTDYQSRGVAFVVIMGNDDRAEKYSEWGFTDVGDSFDDMKVRAAYRKLNYTYLYDGATQAVTKKYGPSATPHIFIFDDKRVLRYQGRIDSNPREQLATKHEARDAFECPAQTEIASFLEDAQGEESSWYRAVAVAFSGNERSGAAGILAGAIL